MKEIKFPAINVSKKWDKNDDISLYVLFDPYMNTANETLYNKYLLNNSFVDSNGNIFKITDRVLPSRIRQILSFIPNLCKVELVFKDTGENMKMEEIRTYILKQLENFDSKFKDEWIKNIRSAKTIEDIIFGDNNLAGQ